MFLGNSMISGASKLTALWESEMGEPSLEIRCVGNGAFL